MNKKCYHKPRNILQGTMLNKWFSYILPLGFILVFMACSTKEHITKQWYKGNLHAHSYWSDGHEFPEMIMDWYKTNDYNFTVLSDHNILAEGDKWITISEKEHLQIGFQSYLRKYGNDWVNHQIDSTGNIRVKLKTYEEYKPLFEEDNKFLIISSEEISTGYNNKPIHINATNIQKFIAPLGGESTVEVIQNNVDAILKQQQETNTTILPHINHTNFRYSTSVNDFIQLKNVRFFEVYNGHPDVNNEGDSTHLSLEKMWDLINISYYEKKQPLLYAVATDDSHQYLELDKKNSNPGRGWVMVQSDSLNAVSLIQAMKKGNFYATTGIILKEIKFYNNTLKIEVEQELETKYEIQFIGVDTNKKVSKIIHKVNGNKAQFKITNNYLFVRAKIISNRTNKNFFDENEFEKAWTQPVIFKKQ